MSEKPIEITAKDILRRPVDALANVKGEGTGFSLKNIKGYIQQAKEIKEALESMGIDLKSLGIKLPGLKKDAGGQGGGDAGAGGQTLTKMSATPAQQILNVLKLLQGIYGDVTLNELIARLKAEFGDRKISEFIKGGGL
jgi:transposase